MACNNYTVENQAPSAGGTNSSAYSANPTFIAPAPPPRTDGRWLAIGNMVGSLVGKYANQEKMDEASDAEDVWRDLNARLKARGLEEFTTNTAAVKTCTDDLYAALCEHIKCGYQPDYQGIAARNTAQVAAQLDVKIADATRAASRYHVGLACDVRFQLRSASMSAVVAATAKEREAERAMTFKMNSALLFDGATRFENTYQERLKVGATMLASAGQNYAWLAESLRRSAEKSASNFATLGTLVAAFALTFRCGLDSDCPEKCA